MECGISENRRDSKSNEIDGRWEMTERRHECIENSQYDIYYAYNEWRIDSNDDSYYGIYDIKYCPFCGIKLMGDEK